MGMQDMFVRQKRGRRWELDYESYKKNDSPFMKPLAPRARSAPPVALKLWHIGPLFLYRRVRRD